MLWGLFWGVLIGSYSGGGWVAGVATFFAVFLYQENNKLEKTILQMHLSSKKKINEGTF